MHLAALDYYTTRLNTLSPERGGWGLNNTTAAFSAFAKLKVKIRITRIQILGTNATETQVDWYKRAKILTSKLLFHVQCYEISNEVFVYKDTY